MGEIIRYVNTGSTPGGNGTTNATDGTDRAYATLAEWEAAEQTDLVTAGNTHLVYCSGATADGVCTVSGWTANATYHITIAQHPDDLPGGKFDATKYRIYSSGWNSVLLTITVVNTYVNLIQGYHAGGGASSNGFVSNAIGGVIFNGLILKRASSTTGTAVSIRGVPGNPAAVYNSVAFGGWETGFDTGSSGSYSKAVNCTAYGNNYNFRGFYEQVLVNCLAAAAGSYDFSRASTYSVTCVNCASSDGTADDHTATDCRPNQTFTFVDAANGDFHLQNSDAGALGYGIGPGSDARVPTADIDGDPRSGSTCDIGADEYVASGGYTLTADSGGFTLTGQNVSLLTDRILPSAAGSFTFTGQAAGLFKGFHLGAASGSFTLSGQAAGLAASRLLAAALSSFTLTGQDVSLLLGYTLAAGAGSFSLAGQDIGLLADRLLAAAPGSLTLTGQDVTLTYTPLGNYQLTAESGSFTLAGQDVALLADRAMTAASGDFSLTGQAVSLFYGRNIATASGNFTLAGQDIGLWADRISQADSGSFTLTWQDVSLFADRSIPADSGPFVLSWQDVSLLIDKMFTADSGSFTLTGPAVTLTYSGVVIPHGKMTISFTSKFPGVAFASKAPSMTFTTQ